MNDDYVKIATKQCPVCLKIHSHNAEIFMHERLKAIPDDKTFTGEGLCEEHQEKFDEGYIALVGVDNEMEGDRLSQEDAHRTGATVLLKRAVFSEMFDTNIDPQLPMVFVEPELIAVLEEWSAEQNTTKH